MQTNISTRHGQLSPETRERISEKTQKLFRFHERLTAIDVTIDLEHRDAPKVEMRLSVERANDFVATDTSDSLTGAVDSVLHKLEEQLRRHKTKLTNRRHAGRRHPDGHEQPSSETEDEDL